MINQIYFFFTALLDLARVRTQWLIENNTITASLMTVALLLKLVILALESIPKYHHVREKSTATPLERSGMFGRALLSWLNPLLFTGYKKNLALEDLYALDHDLKSHDLTLQFQKTWNRGKSYESHCPFLD
jgi:ATP-binding cassette, subfamily C (CFTR/MRP), member 1